MTQMIYAHSCRGLVATFWIAVVAIATAALPTPVAAMRSPAADGNLSPRLSALAQPDLRAASPGLQAAALSLAPQGSGSLLREGNRVLVEVRFKRGAKRALGKLHDAGARIVDVSSRYQAVTAAVKPVDLHAVGATPGATSVSELLAPVVSGVDCGGAVRSEGDEQLNAAAARSSFGIDGSGVEVGILSDSFDRDASAPTHAGEDVLSGDLPGPGSPCGSTTPVSVHDDSAAGGTDEGRAMAQIVHDLAPGTGLFFASAVHGELPFADSIRALRAAGADVIVDDVFYPEEPFFQDGPVAVAVNEATAAGASYFSAAGNDNLVDSVGRNIGSWEAPAYRDAGECPTAIVELSEAIETAEGGGPGLNPHHCMDFDPEAGADETFGITVEAGEELKIDLQWAEAIDGVGTDLDAFLLNGEGKLLTVKIEEKEVPVGSADDNISEGEPLEYLRWRNTAKEDATVQLVINRFAAASGGDPRLKFAFLQNGGGVSSIEYPESSGGDVVGPTVFGHAGAQAAVGVGAIRYDNTTAPEEFSSRGPLTHYFGPWSEAGPAGPITPQVIRKPDLVATDGGANTFFGPVFAGARRFFGTSAAAPHAAAVAALMQQANPALSVSQLRSGLEATARPVDGFGPNAVGAGLINAYAAVSSVALPPVISITERPPALGRNRRPSIAFRANRPVAFTCSLDGGGLAPCSSPFIPLAPLADGVHGFVVQGVDAAGRAGRSEQVDFKIDSRRPRTFFRKHPPKTIRTRKRRARAVFRFGSNEQGVTFACKIDSGFLRFCKPRLVRRFRPGEHVVSVKARDAAGNIDHSPAIFRFRVIRRG